jgi:endonuclease-8
VLFLRGVNPMTPVADVDLVPLVALAARVIRANSTRAVRSTTGDLRAGRTAYVYNRSGQPCRRCGTRIRSRAQGEATRQRTSWWCPACQPER